MDRIDFDKLNRIKGFDFGKINYSNKNEPLDGLILYNNEALYFKFNHEYDEGNTYIVYKNNTPIYYFTISYNEDNDTAAYVFDENGKMIKK